MGMQGHLLCPPHQGYTSELHIVVSLARRSRHASKCRLLTGLNTSFKLLTEFSGCWVPALQVQRVLSSLRPVMPVSFVFAATAEGGERLTGST